MPFLKKIFLDCIIISNEMTASEDSSMQNYTSQNQERYVPLSMILDNAIQKTYHQLTLMIELYVIEIKLPIINESIF